MNIREINRNIVKAMSAGRRSGKTYRMLNNLRHIKGNKIIVVAPDHKASVTQQCNDLGLEHFRVVELKEFESVELRGLDWMNGHVAFDHLAIATLADWGVYETS